MPRSSIVSNFVYSSKIIGALMRGFPLTTLLVATAICAAAQESPRSNPFNLHFDVGTRITPTEPTMPRSFIHPNVGPSFSPISGISVLPDRYMPGTTFRLPPETAARISAVNSTMPLSQPIFDFHGNPYSRDWAASGTIATVGTGSITASGSHTTLPALGTMGSASLSYVQPIGERFTFSLGASAIKYHIDREAWNDYGFNAKASYKLSDKFSLNAFGQYYFYPRFAGAAAMGYMQNSNIGGTIGMQLSDNVKLDVGAQSYYDVYNHCWRTIPIVAPTFKLFGSPVSFDVGGLLYEIISAIIDSKSSHSYIMPAGGGSSATPTMGASSLARDIVPLGQKH